MGLIKCLRCGKDAVKSIGFDRPFCAEHYVEEEEDHHLGAYLARFNDPDDPIVQEIIRQKPGLLEIIED